MNKHGRAAWVVLVVAALVFGMLLAIAISQIGQPHPVDPSCCPATPTPGR